MKVLIIGNGFDLAHGLPTSYSNFLDFIKTCRSFNITNGDCEKNEYYEFCKKTKDTLLFNEIIEHINTNSRLLDYFLGIYEKRCLDGKRGWIDFESEISSIIQALDEARKLLIENENSEDISLPSNVYAIVEAVLLVSENEDESGDTFPEDFKDGKADELLDGLNRLTRLLEIYLSYYIASTEITKRLPEFSNKKYTHVLSFNYTTTYMRLYDPNKEAQYCYIHGEAKENSSLSDCNMVLGIDEYQSDCDRNNNNHYVWFKKFFQRINKETSTEYDDWCRRIEEIAVKFQKTNAPQNELFIFGHSLDVTDKDIISRFIMGRNTTTYIYYYSKDDKAKKIENLVKVIGEDNLIRKTQGSKRTIHFIKTEKAIDLSKE